MPQLTVDHLTHTPLRDIEEQQEQELVLLFAPLHKRAFGFATGLAVGIVVFLATALYLLRPNPAIHLELLAQYFYGYTVSWRGALVGLAWGCLTGFVAGWFAAFCRNLALVLSLLLVRSRAELDQTRDFLDHI